MTLTVWAPEGVPEVRPGDDLAALLLAAVATDGRTLADGDVVVVTSKVVSKAEGRVVDGADREAAIDAETVRLVARRGGTRIVRNRLGLTMAAAGVDASNVEPGRVVLLPEDPDASARALRAALAARTGLNVAVLLTDTAGRTWREGQTDLAIGAAGLVVAVDHQGDVDGYGNPLAVTLPAVADEVAGAADLVRGKLTGRPFAVARGLADLVLPPGDDGPGARSLVRADGQDLFGYGAREAVVRALAGRPGDRAAFGSPASAEEVVEALRSVHREGWLAAVPRPDGGLDLELTGPAALRAVEAACFAFGWEVAASRSVGPDAAEARIQPATP